MTVQIHDYNGTIAPSGLFWTKRVPDDRFSRNENGARIEVEDLEMVDSFQLFSGIEVPATVSYDITWTASQQGVNRLRPGSSSPTDPTNLAAQFRNAIAVGTFSGSSITEPGGIPFTFEGEATSEPVWAEMGMERNGSLLHSQEE